ncbi:variant erythrocyte surface antigen-1 family protein [Babesia caballi]|uniref:Variant erythrocyte surface antigen-1 family protein n=1 Tax=Babesia caballi TaxID=5871 RepID=A0AAV4LPJ2_BABCB|nr:variant erythrocyte surface antigen-1 family protein [Babesia caballi]
MTTHQKNSLTEWPDDLKDVIDWFLRVGEIDKGGSGDSNKLKLQNAVKALTDYGEASTVLKAENTGGPFSSVTEGLRVFIGYNTSGGRELDGSGIGLSSYGGYASSYKDSAKWNGGWNASDSNSKTCAHILLASTPLPYYGLTYLFWRCSDNDGWQEQTTSGDSNGSQFYYFLLDMGYSSGLNSGKKGSEVMNRVESEITDFKKVPATDSSSYPEFLKQLQETGKPNLANSAMNAPMYALYAASHAYLQSKLSSSKITELPQTKSDISKTLKGYSDAVEALNPGSSQKLPEAYLTLLAQIQSVNDEDPPAPPSSSAAAAAGDVLGTAALGGTAAALATNVGGITTTLKNFIPLFK